jgi:hypothetical protein
MVWIVMGIILFGPQIGKFEFSLYFFGGKPRTPYRLQVIKPNKEESHTFWLEHPRAFIPH